MSDNSSRDLIIGAALALLLYWHFHKRGGGLSVSLQTNGLPATAPSGAAGAGTPGGGGCCSGRGANAPLPPLPIAPGFSPHIVAETAPHGPYAGMSAVV